MVKGGFTMLGRWMDLETRSLGSHKGVRAENIWDTEIFGGDLSYSHILKLVNEKIKHPLKFLYLVYGTVVSP